MAQGRPVTRRPIPPAARALAAESVARRAALPAARAAADAARLAAVAALRAAGYSLRDVAVILGLSHQRVGQIVADSADANAPGSAPPPERNTMPEMTLEERIEKIQAALHTAGAMDRVTGCSVSVRRESDRSYAEPWHAQLSFGDPSRPANAYDGRGESAKAALDAAVARFAEHHKHNSELHARDAAAQAAMLAALR